MIALSPPGAGTIPIPASIQLLVPLPSTPVESTTIWGGVAGAMATLKSGLRKTSDMGQTLGNALNILQQAQDYATQSADLLNGGIGNLTDADMGKVSARVVALQLQKQLAAQSLALDNHGAGLILQLFK
jgi:flagellin-like hook-associated protein FlgL